MKAVRVHVYGDRSVLQFEDAPKPEIKPDEALVRIVAAAVNPIDWKIRQGHLKTMVPYVFPLTLGWDFSGVIEALGSEVSGLAVGDAVFSRPDIRRDGSYAEYVAVRAVEIARKPKTISHIEAASIPLVGITAWETIVSVGNLVAGQKALIHAASGGVGSLAVQIACCGDHFERQHRTGSLAGRRSSDRLSQPAFHRQSERRRRGCRYGRRRCAGVVMVGLAPRRHSCFDGERSLDRTRSGLGRPKRLRAHQPQRRGSRSVGGPG